MILDDALVTHMRGLLTKKGSLLTLIPGVGNRIVSLDTIPTRNGNAGGCIDYLWYATCRIITTEKLK